MLKTVYRAAALSGLTLLAVTPTIARTQQSAPDPALPFGSPLDNGKGEPALPPGGVMDGDSEAVDDTPPIQPVGADEAKRIADCFGFAARTASAENKTAYTQLAGFFKKDGAPLAKMRNERMAIYQHGSAAYLVGANFDTKSGFIVKAGSADADPLPIRRTQADTILRCLATPQLV